MSRTSKNVFGEPIQECSLDPITGFYRNGCCDTGTDDYGNHMVCAIMTREFLQFSKKNGNDLITPNPAFDFPGLSPGDRWCLCVNRWKEALEAGLAPPVLLESTNEKALDFVKMTDLLNHAFKTTDL